MENKLINEIRKEISLLESWINISENNGWSTQLVVPMKKRILELNAIIFDIENK